MFSFHQHSPEVFALSQIELDKIIADTEACTGTEDFDLPKKILVQPDSLIQVFLKKDIFSYFAEQRGQV